VTRQLWQDILLPPGNEDHLWELFHENSKISRYYRSASNEEVLGRLREFHESLPYVGYPAVNLPRSLTALGLSLEKAITTRASVRNMVPCLLTLENVATLLHYAYGVTRDSNGGGLPRALRAAPSGGGLYPLELYFHSTYIEGLQGGLYHYNPAENNLRLLHAGDDTRRISEALVHPDIATGASLIILITAVFERTIFKYGDRGYRFLLLEAGHVAQNINLVVNGLGLGCVDIGGFFDRQIDDLLGLDGLTHSTIYRVAIGKKEDTLEEVDGMTRFVRS
jgi:SagB-type dehydrogenase family enzyme